MKYDEINKLEKNVLFNYNIEYFCVCALKVTHCRYLRHVVCMVKIVVCKVYCVVCINVVCSV